MSYFSFAPDPTPAFLPWTETLPSSNPQEAATVDRKAAQTTRNMDGRYVIDRMIDSGVRMPYIRGLARWIGDQKLVVSSCETNLAGIGSELSPQTLNNAVRILRDFLRHEHVALHHKEV